MLLTTASIDDFEDECESEREGEGSSIKYTLRTLPDTFSTTATPLQLPYRKYLEEDSLSHLNQTTDDTIHHSPVLHNAFHIKYPREGATLKCIPPPF